MNKQERREFLLERVKPTRIKQLGFVCDGPGCWRLVDLEDGGRTGPIYGSREELFADIERWTVAVGW